MDNKTSFRTLIQSNIDHNGYHLTVVGGAVEPRFAYSIGLFNSLNFELVFSGGVYYLKDQILEIFRDIVNNLRVGASIMDRKITIVSLGDFSFLPVDSSWRNLMLLGVIDYYKGADIPAYQIVPDPAHFTYDIPDMSKKWDVSTEPVWQWLDRKWQYDVPEKSQVTTNLEALQGAAITE